MNKLGFQSFNVILLLTFTCHPSNMQTNALVNNQTNKQMNKQTNKHSLYPFNTYLGFQNSHFFLTLSL